MNVNLRGAFLIARRMLPGMKQRRWGRIIFLGSMLSFVAIPGRAAYGASKTAVLALARTLALEAASFGVCVNALCPGPFTTPMNEVVTENMEARESFVRRIPLGRWGEPSDLQGLALYLASPSSSFMTGAAVVIDGGWTAQ